MTGFFRIAWAATLLSLALAIAALGQRHSFATPHIPDAHDREFWRSIVQHGYAVPESDNAFVLARELSGLLGSPDPELRDELAYSILDAWIGDPKKLSQGERLELLAEWRANLRDRLGESGTDSVFKRSFSALCLASLAEYDLKTPFLGASLYRGLLADAVAYLKEEHDLRGYDGTKGWIQATAHTADLLSALAANPRFTRNDQQAILAAVGDRLSSAATVYSHGEQSRLAQAVVAIVKRADFDEPSFQGWLAQWKQAERARLSQKPLTPAVLAAYQNFTYMLEAFVARMTLGNLSAAATRARDTVAAIIQRR